jgi:hypothetical protein
MIGKSLERRNAGAQVFANPLNSLRPSEKLRLGVSTWSITFYRPIPLDSLPAPSRSGVGFAARLVISNDTEIVPKVSTFK